MWRRHSEGFLVSEKKFDKIGGFGGLYFNGTFSVLLGGAFEMLTFERVFEAIMGEKNRHHTCSLILIDEGEMLGDE